MGTALAFAAIDGGMPLMVLLMCMCHAASQVSPTHVCLVVASDYFHITLGDLIRKILPRSLAFCGLMIGYCGRGKAAVSEPLLDLFHRNADFQKQ